MNIYYQMHEGSIDMIKWLPRNIPYHWNTLLYPASGMTAIWIRLRIALVFRAVVHLSALRVSSRRHGHIRGEIAMPGPTSIQGTLIIKHAPAVRPVNSRVPCYFEYKNFQEIAERGSETAGGRATGTRERERERKGGTEKAREREGGGSGFEILQGLPRQPSKRVTELSICMSERCRVSPPAMRINIQSAHDRLRFRLPRVSISPPFRSPLVSPLFSIYFMPSFSRRCRARFFQVTRFIRANRAINPGVGEVD